MKKDKWLKTLKYLIAFLIPLAGVMLWNNTAIDNDSWYVIAEGREIVENGIYHTDQLSMHEGLEVTVQNYGFAVIFDLVYSAVGPVGLYLCMLLLNIIICVILYKICMLISNKNVNLSLFLMIFTDLVLGFGWIVTRAQVASYIIFLLVIYLLELYIRKKNSKYLWWIPVLALMQINLHASVWPMILILLGVYIIDSIRAPKLHLQGYKTWPLILALLASIGVGLINPYGVKMMTFILTSYGVPEAQNTISELYPFAPLGSNNLLVGYLCIAGALVAYIFGKNRNIRMRYLILIFGFLALGMNTIKGLPHLILVLFWPLAEVYKEIDTTKIATRKVRWMTLSWGGILATSIIIAWVILGVPYIAKSAENVEVAQAVDALDAEVEKEASKGDDKDINRGAEEIRQDLKIYVGFNHGGYLEYRGYKSYIDPRMEVFLKVNNDKEDIFKEWYDLEHHEIPEEEFLEKYKFDYIIAKKDEALYNTKSDKYELIYEEKVGELAEDTEENSEEDERTTIRIYKKVAKEW